MRDRETPLLAPDRVRIYLTLVPYLAERGPVSLQSAAADFGVTVDEMRSMAQKLTVMGLPGESGYFQLDPDLFNINWDLLDSDDVIELTNTVALERAPKLSAREAAALLSGLQLIRTIPETRSHVIDGLIAKLNAGSADASVDVIVAPAEASAVQTAVAEALTRGRAVSFTYRAPDAPATTRTVDPVRVHITSGEWYLQGWCHMRKAMRTFHLDRVSDIALTETSSEHTGTAEVARFVDSSETANSVIRFSHAHAPLVGDYLVNAELVHDGVVTTARLRVGDPLTLKRLAARAGGMVEVLAPTAARAASSMWARDALAQYDVEPSGAFPTA